jgi:hypothetical protein
VGVHPHNRDGVGVSVSEVHSLIDDILAVGFSKEEAGKCVCIKVGAADAHIRDFNDRLSAMSNGKLGNLQPQATRHASVAVSHLNAGINCWLHGIMVYKANHPRMAEPFRLVKYHNLPRYITK